MKGLTKYERARVIGARALQIAMGAPILIKLKDAEFEKINYRETTSWLSALTYDPADLSRLDPLTTGSARGV